MEDGERGSSESGIDRAWLKIPFMIRSLVIGIAVLIIGIYAPLIAASVIPAPWSFLSFLGVSGILVKYFSGGWWPKATSGSRKHNFREVSMPGRLWTVSLLASLLLVVVVQSGFVFTFRILEYPADTMTSAYNFGEISPWEAWLTIIIAALSAGIFEEIGFRGYLQVPLEERYGPIVGVGAVSLLFLLFHLNQGWLPAMYIHVFVGGALYGIIAYVSGSLIPGMIAHTLIDVFMFSYWWSDVAGVFRMLPIGVTGVDTHFILWTLVFVASSALFYVAARKSLELKSDLNASQDL